MALLESPSDGALFASPELDTEYERALADVLAWTASGYRVVTVLDEGYPSRLLEIRETPPFLFYEGMLQQSDEGVSVVGSRAASEEGLRFAAEAAELLVAEGLTVISGLAAGIDAAAHRATLAVGARAVAVLGTGITRSYPRVNAELQREISQSGLLLSQFYPDAPPTKRSFPMRNATMSGYFIATVVVEAGEHSGARIQARLAGEHGRPVILTDSVVAGTSWGRSLAAKPNVYVVGPLADLRGAIQRVRDAPRRLRESLDTLVNA